MRFQIVRLILWPRDPAFQPAVTTFQTGALNVLSGVSRTGKSAVIPIIDYCLGANHCAIPVDTIRRHCGWFGVVVSTAEGEKLFARREPGQAKVTGDMFTAEAKTVEIPSRIDAGNTTVDAVKHRLDALAGLTLLDFDPDATGSGFLGRPSFRDMMAFCFQPQNIIANQNVLFYGADSHAHREKLRTIFPYVLGAVTPELLAKQHRLAELRKEHARKTRELTTVRQVSERWLADMQRWVTEARELRLLPATAERSAATRDRAALIDLLRVAVARRDGTFGATADSIEASGRELVELRAEESAAATETIRLRGRMHEMQTLKSSTEQFRNDLTARGDRLQVATWLAELRATAHQCPICGSDTEPMSSSHLDELLAALRDVEASVDQYERVPAAFDRELERVRRELTLAVERLGGVRLRIKALSDETAKSRQERESAYRIDRFLGRLEQALTQLEEVGEDGELAAEVERLTADIEGLAREVGEAEVRRRRELALTTVSSLAQGLLQGLDVEHPESQMSLSIENLSVKVSTPERESFLWEIGSGSNWLSYHLALSLGLQQYFIRQKSSPVPSFLVFDQPSQVYFPRKLAERQDDAATDLGQVVERPIDDEDVIAVRKAFDVLARAVRDSDGRLQAIVLDHAASTVWGDVGGIVTVADWRAGRKLVPLEWIREGDK